MQFHPLKAWRSLRAVLAFSVAWAILLSSAMAAETITVDHVQGQTNITVAPEKVVVFDPAILDILDTLGVKATAVADAPLPEHLSEYTRDTYPKVGTLFEPDYEAIHAVGPDLIIVGGRTAPKFKDLARLAPTIDLTPDPANLPDSVARNTRILARIFAKQDQAEVILAQLDDAIQTLHDKASQAGTGLIILTVGGKMSAYGPGSRFGVLHEAFGITPAAPDLAVSNHGQAVSFEFVHKTDPDWLLVIDRDAAIGREGMSARQLLDNELMHKTTAWNKDQIIYLDAMNWYLLGSAGLTAMQQNIDELSRALDGQ